MTVNIDYHVAVSRGHYYSVPAPVSVGEKLDLHCRVKRWSNSTSGNNGSPHTRARTGPGSPLTRPFTCPHAIFGHNTQWFFPERLLRWAREIRTWTLDARGLSRQLARRAHPEQAYRVCLGLLHLSKRLYPPAASILAPVVCARTRTVRWCAYWRVFMASLQRWRKSMISIIHWPLTIIVPSWQTCWIAPPEKFARLTWVGIGLASFQQLVGINVVFYYGAVLWQAVGFSESDALLVNVISGAVSIIACLVAITLVDKVGRKPILWVGSLGMAVTLSLMAFAFSTASNVDGQLTLSGNMGVLALLAANAYVMVFNGSWGPVMWVMLGEMFPNQLRGSGLAIAGLSQWGVNFLITITFPVMLTIIGFSGAYCIYAASAVLSAVFVYKLVHETRGLELEEMPG